MQLEDNKQSITTMTNEEAIAIHRDIRDKRMTVGVTTQSKAKATKRKAVTKNMKEIRQDPEKIKELLRLLGEDV